MVVKSQRERDLDAARPRVLHQEEKAKPSITKDMVKKIKKAQENRNRQQDIISKIQKDEYNYVNVLYKKPKFIDQIKQRE